jgi:hypothetical protein
MSTPTPKGQYVHVGTDPHPFTLWFDQKAGDSIHLTSGDPRFTDENHERPGLRVVFSSNPNSADYNPGNFNRCARVLKSAGKAAPEEVPLESRRLADRSKVKVQLKSHGPLPADPDQFGWQACVNCGCVIISAATHSCHAS